MEVELKSLDTLTVSGLHITSCKLIQNLATKEQKVFLLEMSS